MTAPILRRRVFPSNTYPNSPFYAVILQLPNSSPAPLNLTSGVLVPFKLSLNPALKCSSSHPRFDLALESFPSPTADTSCHHMLRGALVQNTRATAILGWLLERQTEGYVGKRFSRPRPRGGMGTKPERRLE